MTINLTDLNWLGIIIASIVYFIFGGLWFSPIGFQKQWDKAIGFDRPKTWKPTAIYYLGPYVGGLIASLAHAILILNTKIDSLSDSILLGLITGLGFAFAISYINAITPKMKNPKLYGLITGLYHTIGFVIITVIIYLL